MRSLFGTARQRLDVNGRALHNAARGYIPGKMHTLHLLERRLNRQTPQDRMALRSSRLTELRSRLESAARFVGRPGTERLSRLDERLQRVRTNALGSTTERLNRLGVRLTDLNPEALLARGYAIVTVNGKAVRDAGAIAAGTLIEARVEHGKSACPGRRNAP